MQRKIDVRVIASLLMLVALTLASRAALAEKFDCESIGGLSPYPAAPSAIHDHDRYAPRITGIAKEFAAYVAVFDDADDDDGDGTADLLAMPVMNGIMLRLPLASSGQVSGDQARASECGQAARAEVRLPRATSSGPR